MQFNSLLYLVFLAVVLTGSWLLLRPGQAFGGVARLAFLLVASCLFYMAWSPAFILLLLGCNLSDFLVGRALERTPDTARNQRRALLAWSLIVDFGCLAYFKYLNFFVQNATGALQALGLDVAAPVLEIVLPVGISFYTFQSVAYVVDVYRREIPAERSWPRFALFISFFPQLVAGPIVKAQELLPQLAAPPRLDRDRVGQGLYRIGRGLAKKVVVADILAINLVDRVFSNPGVYSSAEVLVGLYAYSMQIYCDFSGYTDVAIGSAMLLGYDLPDNFDRPYRARTVAEFWRRWHKTLSAWLRHYVFFPLGGSRGSIWRAHRNTLITLVLIGLWHGANWTFVIYGLIHGLAICVNRVLTRNRPRDWDEDAQPWPQVLWKIALTFHFVVLARILFRAPGLDEAGTVWSALWTSDWSLARIDDLTWAVLLGSFAIHFSPPDWTERLRRTFVAMPAYAQGFALAALAAGMGTVAETDVVPFIYFQF